MDVDLSYRPGEGLPFTELERIRTKGPAFWSDALGGWAVTSYAAVKEVLSDPGRFTSEGTPLAEAFAAEAMVVTDTPQHHIMRAVWLKHVSKAAWAEKDADLRKIVSRLLEPIRQRLDVGETVNLVDVFQDYVIAVIGWMFKVSAERLPDLKRWNQMFSDAPALELSKDSPLYATHLAAKAEVYAFLREEMAARRARPGSGEAPDDLISLMVAAEGQNGITRAVAEDNLFNFFLGALDTTVKWLGNIMIVLDRHRDVLAEVRANRALLPQAMEEVMRLETVAQALMRLVRNDGTILEGTPMQAGQPVIVFLGAANRDPAMFERPDVLDIHRPAALHLGFGFGFHHCLGVNTARQETLSFLSVLLDRFPALEVKACEYGKSWAVWGPEKLWVRSGKSLEQGAS